jgi:hypothetical protein
MMTDRIKNMLISAGLLVFLLACEFIPSEIPLTELEQPSDDLVPQIGIELTPGMDTLRIASSVWITFTAETGGRQIYNIRVELDGAPLGSITFESANKIRAYIPAEPLKDGFHEIKITTFTATNSGSIADKTGHESYGYELRWPVYVNKKARDNFKLKAPELTPEGILISWPRYLYADFNRYVVTTNYNFSNRNTISLTNPHLNSFMDNGYIEGIYVNYAVALYFSEWEFRIDDINWYESIKKPQVVINDDLTVDVSWNRSKNEQEVKYYCLRTSTPEYGIPEEQDIEDLTTTTARLEEKIGFGGNYQVQLRYIPKWFDSYHSTLSTAGGVATFALGDSIPPFEQAVLSTAENSFILYNQGTFSKYNFHTGESSASVSVTPVQNVYLWTVAGSPDGNYFGHFSNHEYVVRQSSDLSVVQRMNIHGYSGYNFVLSSVSLSNNGLVGVTDHNNNLKIFDVGTGQKIFEKQFESNYFLRKVILSPDGKNLALMFNDYQMGTTSLAYYTFNGTGISELGRVNGVGYDVSAVMTMSPESQHKIAVSRWHSMYNYTVEVRDSRTFDLLHQAQIPGYFMPVAYDFIADRVVSQYNSFPTRNSLLTNLISGQQNQIVQLTGREPLIFNGGTLYAGNGRKINPDNYITD